jgi:hypothetical protein
MPSLLVENTLPGVSVIVNATQVGSPIVQQPSSTAFVVGYSPWGPVGVPTIVTSWSDFVRQFGGFDANSYLDDFAHVFFNLYKGARMRVSRVVGAAAAKATITLSDRAVAPLATLRLDGKYPSSRVDIKEKVEAGTTAGTVKLTLRSVMLNIREVFDDIKMDAASMERINQGSNLVTATNLNSATAAPNNLPALSAVVNGVVTETALAGGSDDFAGITAARYVGIDDGETRTGLQAFNDELLGGGQVAIPGITAGTVHTALVAHAELYHRLALLDPPLGSDKADMVAIRLLFGTWYGAIHWPWVLMLDHAGSELAKYYPPSCFAAGACARVDREIGVHKAPANIGVPNALNVETLSTGQTQTDAGTREYLNGNDINVITMLPQEGIKIYGERVMTGSNRRVSRIHEIRVLNVLYYSFKIAYAYAVFSVVDGSGKLFRELRSVGEQFLRTFYQAGALFGEKEEDAFVVVCDDGNNPPSELDAGRVHVDIGVKISPAAETIIINIDNVPNSQDLSVLQ